MIKGWIPILMCARMTKKQWILRTLDITFSFLVVWLYSSVLHVAALDVEPHVLCTYTVTWFEQVLCWKLQIICGSCYCYWNLWLMWFNNVSYLCDSPMCRPRVRVILIFFFKNKCVTVGKTCVVNHVLLRSTLCTLL